jgi:hypothetical protein
MVGCTDLVSLPRITFLTAGLFLKHPTRNRRGGRYFLDKRLVTLNPTSTESAKIEVVFGSDLCTAYG